MAEMTEYKFRAECGVDVQLFFGAVAMFAHDHVPQLKPDTPASGDFGDAGTFILKTTLTLEELCSIAATCTDWHVIQDTIMPSADYTGERLWRNAAAK